LYNLVKLIALYRLTGDFWLGIKFFKSFIWLVTGVLFHFMFWDLLFFLSIDHLFTNSIDAFLYSIIEILVFLIWTLFGVYILNLSPDLKSSLNRILNWNKK